MYASARARELTIECIQLDDVGVITKPYFVFFVAFIELMIFNLAQRSFQVIHFGGNRKPVYDFGDNASFVCPEPIFPYPTPIPAKIWGYSLSNRSVMLGSAKRGKVSLISLEIIFQEFQHI